jgi:HIRAN domain
MSLVLVIAVIALSVWVWIERRKNRALGSVPQSAVLARQGDEYTVQALDLSDPAGECDFHIVGESNYQPELRRVAKSGRTFLAVLAAERNNPRDANAIRVCAEGGRTVGYLSRDYAIEYREVFALLEQHGRVGACRAKLIGGVGAKKSFGVMLNLKDVETILVDIRDTLAPGTAVSPNVQPF